MTGRDRRSSAWRCLAAVLFLSFGLPCRGQEDETVDLSVSQTQAGGYVLDKGTRLVEDKRLKISFVPQFETFRSQAPLNVSVRVLWSGPGLLEGRLLCDVYADDRYVGSWRSQELAVNDQVLSFPLILPPSPLYDERRPYNLRIAFEAADRTIEMDPRDLPVESAWARNYVVGVIAPENVTRISGFKSDERTPQVAEIFQLATFHDDIKHVAQFVVNTSPVTTRDVPVDPLRLTAFDLIVVSPESLRELRPPQWKALATWIRAGGRTCLVATLPVPENLRASWRELFNERPDEPVMVFDADGRPQFTEGGSRCRVRAGCGRILCLTEAADIDSRPWLDDLLWLYGVRDASKSAIMRTGKWNIGRPPMELTAFHPLVPEIRPIPALRLPLNSPDVGRVSLMTILLLLGTCLMLIGPVDYYVLGRLGLRRLTWVFLPCVAIATTWATMRVSQSALGAKDYARSVSIADLDSMGRVVRVSRIEQHYAGRESVTKRSLTNSLRVDFERPLYGWNAESSPLTSSDRVGVGDNASNHPPLRYSGRVSGGYDVIEPMFQWSPRLFRETTFGDDPRVDSQVLAAIDWTELGNTTWATIEGRAKLLGLVRKAIPEANVYVRAGLTTLDCSSDKTPVQPLNPKAAMMMNNGRLIVRDQPGSGINFETAPDRPESLIQLIGEATSCQRSCTDYSREFLPYGIVRPYGLFGLVRERSPTCGADLEDLQWIDSDDPTEAVLMILVPGEDSVVYRRRLALAAEAR